MHLLPQWKHPSGTRNSYLQRPRSHRLSFCGTTVSFGTSGRSINYSSKTSRSKSGLPELLLCDRSTGLTQSQHSSSSKDVDELFSLSPHIQPLVSTIRCTWTFAIFGRSSRHC